MDVAAAGCKATSSFPWFCHLKYQTGKYWKDCPTTRAFLSRSFTVWLPDIQRYSAAAASWSLRVGATYQWNTTRDLSRYTVAPQYGQVRKICPSSGCSSPPHWEQVNTLETGIGDAGDGEVM